MLQQLFGKPSALKVESPETLHLLIVEHVLEDLELMLLTLESAGLSFTYDNADTLAKCQQLLLANSYDMVLSDYRLPQFNAIAVLNVLKQSKQDIPFILVTGTLGEEAAVASIKAGVTDYVLKDRLFRLPSVLERGLQEFALRRQQQAATHKIQQQILREALLSRIVQAMRGTLILDEILQITVDRLHAALSVDRSFIFVADANRRTHVSYLSQATVDRLSLLNLECPFCAHFQDRLANGEIVVLAEISSDLPQILQQTSAQLSIRSLLIVPLLYQQTYIGGIALHQSDRPRQWTEDEISLVKSVADQCAIALHQSELYNSAQAELAERKRIEHELRQSEERFRSAIEHMPVMMSALDRAGNISTWNQECERVTGFSAAEIVDNPEAFALLYPDPIYRQQMLAAWAERGNNYRDWEWETTCKDGTVKTLSWSNISEKFPIPHWMSWGVAVDVSPRIQAEKQLRVNAFYDRLTGLPNRALFLDRLEHALGRSQRQELFPLAVLCLDIDRFKIVNDSLGHLAGDQLLCKIARRLENCIRIGDTIARLSGDEFGILLEDVTGIDTAIQISDRIHQELTMPMLLDGHEVFVSVSIGIAMTAKDTIKPEHLLRNADTAMYKAKEHGRARYEIFATSMYTHALDRLKVENELRRAIERQELVVYYQPIVSLASGALQGFEALVRWQHPVRGLLSPSEFIPIAEESGLITSIDRWVLLQACQQLKRWQQNFPSLPPLVMSVNLSARQFSQPTLIEQIDQILRITLVRGSSLKIEVTETAIIKKPELAKIVLQQLRDRQICVCLDDFGTGYSSLSYLHQFPVDTLKIDRSFISSMDRESGNHEIVKAIINLGLNLAIDVIAEGIETSAQKLLLTELGCQSGQGYLFSRPMEPTVAANLIADRQYWVA
ncbi:EAL domain-containing protein [Tumidithrix helvetica PCC 7403]|uniref:putative bifunctional diguanylate cyclase/phosphodiesterase n=1 Tax=Tumidithrix helvetica TaxID=3457545 RepID=UPI003CA034D9